MAAIQVISGKKAYVLVMITPFLPVAAKHTLLCSRKPVRILNWYWAYLSLDQGKAPYIHQTIVFISVAAVIPAKISMVLFRREAPIR